MASWGVEHKGVNNRILRQLGWVVVSRGKRDSPRNSELTLRPREELLALRKELVFLQQDAPTFLARVFGSRDPVWVERCSSIIQDSGTPA